MPSELGPIAHGCRRFAQGTTCIAQGTTVLMVEQNVKSAGKVADGAVAPESGRCVRHKPASQLLADPHTERLFLGGHRAVSDL